jgi:FAD/FMN-containing dehydrogenase
MSQPVAPPPRRRRWLRWSLRAAGLLLLVALALIARPAFVLTRAWLRDGAAAPEPPPGHADDASRLNSTAVREVVDVEAEGALREVLARARRDRLKVSIAGARHTMGGHTIAAGGVVLNMLPFNALRYDDATGLLTAGAGARWGEVVPFLDARGRSVAVMQSNNDFSVGGSLSANGHGWQHGRPPLCSTVESFRLMTADGRVVRCSRGENRELFSLALGGYGLFGVILDAELRTVPNAGYRLRPEVVAADDFPAAFARAATDDPAVGMAFGRLCVVPGETTFLREASLTTFAREEGPPPALASVGYRGLARLMFRAQADSDYGKALRWKSEKRAAAHFSGRLYSRNQLLNEGSDRFAERSADRTDVLQEYFVPPGRFAEFVNAVRRRLPREPLDLFNVTVREVRRDDDSFLRYADGDMFSLVLLFNVPRTDEAEAAMQAVTRELIDDALAAGGRYYLPYRLHATREQFERAYPRGREFFARKRKYDPHELFDNTFYRRYGAAP